MATAQMNAHLQEVLTNALGNLLEAECTSLKIWHVIFILEMAQIVYASLILHQVYSDKLVVLIT